MGEDTDVESSLPLPRCLVLFIIVRRISHRKYPFLFYNYAFIIIAQKEV